MNIVQIVLMRMGITLENNEISVIFEFNIEVYSLQSVERKMVTSIQDLFEKQRIYISVLIVLVTS